MEVVAGYMDPHLLLPIVGFMQVPLGHPIRRNSLQITRKDPESPFFHEPRDPTPGFSGTRPQGKGIIDEKESLKQQAAILGRTKLVDYHIDVAKALSGSSSVPKELEARK